jgi:signal transduction histidine kinase
MIGAVGAIAAIAYWDEQRESQAALEDFALEQATLARSVAAELHARLALAGRDAMVAAELEEQGRAPPRGLLEGYLELRVRPSREGALPAEPRAFQASLPLAGGRTVDLALSMSSLTAGFRAIDRPNAAMVLLLPPGAGQFHAADGRVVASEELRAALERGEASLRLPRPQAAALGLPRRTAVAGLAWVDGGRLGRWGVAVVANAQRQRDREWRARWRLLLAVLVAGGLVLAFGGLALRKQRKEMELERGLAIAELQRRRDERLERADRAATLGTFAMGIAHEISTPLGVIAGRAEQLLAQVSSDERAVRAARAIVEQTDRIHQVIRAFLGLARGDSPPDQDISPPEIVAGATALCEHRFARAGVTLEAEVPDGLPPVRGDPRLLEHALVNLLLNACDACEPGGRVRLEVGGGDTVSFAVSDDGIGIARSDAARATEPFFTTKPNGAGAGLGLAIVSEIVKHHRGRLAVGPRAPRGTVARIELPADGRRPA